MAKKKDSASLRSYHLIKLELGLIIPLLLIIGACTSQSLFKKADGDVAVENDTSEIGDIISSNNSEHPPAPPRPNVPVNLPNDEIISLQNIDFAINSDRNMRLIDDFSDLMEQNKEENKEDIFVVVEKQPRLKGGLNALHQKIVYPEVALENGIEGKVMIQFVINKMGEVENPKVLRGIGGGCDKEALRVVKTAGFTPGMQRDKPVHVRFTLPITFKIGN